jgi:ribosomal-protein-serine acetyltransferase
MNPSCPARGLRFRSAAANGATRVIAAGPDLYLKPVSPADGDAIYAAIERNRERLREWLSWAVPEYSREDLNSFLTEKEQANAARSSLTTAICQGGAICGLIGFHPINLLNRNTSLGYWIDGSYEGRGLITRSCRAIVTEGFKNFGLHRIEIRCATGNHRSNAVPRRLGFREEGILRDAEWLHGRWVDLRVYSALSTEWQYQTGADSIESYTPQT